MNPARERVEATGAILVPSGDGVAAPVRNVAPDGVDLLADLVCGDALRARASLVRDPSGIVSAAEATTAVEPGGAGRKRSEGVLAKIAGDAEYGLVDPHVIQTDDSDRAAEAMAAVESGHSNGKAVIVS